MIAATVFILGAAVQTGVTNVGGMVAGRVVAGLGVGLISMMVPMYQAELAPKEVRGALIACYQLFITIGILLAQGLDYATEGLSNSGAWRIPIGLQLAWGLMMLVGCAFIPESRESHSPTLAIYPMLTIIASSHHSPFPRPPGSPRGRPRVSRPRSLCLC